VKASKFLDANGIEVKETVPASRKLGADDAAELLGQASRLIAAKGKNLIEFRTAGDAADEATAAMLGPTGNLRAPTLRIGKTLLVGFNEEAYQNVLL